MIEPRTVATLTLTVRRSNHMASTNLARSHPHLARSHPHLDTFLHFHAYMETSSELCVFLHLCQVEEGECFILVTTH